MLIKEALNLQKGSAMPHRDKVGTLTQAQLREIAETQDARPERERRRGAMQIIAGTARSMGVEVEA